MSPYDFPDARPLIPSKIRMPRVDSLTLSRPRLEVVLDQVASIPLGILRAPAGFGKTTLMTYWAHRQVSRLAWYSLDELDNDPPLFSRYLLLTLKQQLPELQTDLDRIEEVMHLYDLMWLIGKLCNILNKLEQQIFLALDNYHLINQEKIHEAIRLLVQHQPSSLHIFVLTRGEPPLGLAKLRLNGLVHELIADDLKFTQDEAMQFLSERVSQTPDTALLHAVFDRLNGWPAGLQIIALSAPTAHSITNFLSQFNGTHAHVLDFLAEEILSKQTAPLQEFMLKSSVVDRFNAELATAVTGMEESFSLIQLLEKRGLFISPIDEANQWYRYHPFFVEFLQHQLNLRYPRSDIDELHMNAYHWWLNNNTLQDALQHVLLSQNVDLMVETLETHGWTLFQQGHMTLIERTLAILPANIIAEHYKLALLKAWVSTTQADTGALQQALSQVEQQLPSKVEDKKWRCVSAEIYALKAQMCAAAEDIPSAKRYAKQALKDASNGGSNANAVALSVLGEVHVCEGRLAKALASFQKAEKIARESHSIQALLWAMAQQADILFYQGDLIESYQHQTTLFQVASEHFLSQIPVMEFIHRRRAELCLEWYQLHEAKQHCDSGLKVIEPLESHCKLPINAINALISIHQEHFDTAQQYLDLNSRIMKETTCHTDWISLAMHAQLLYWHKQDNISAIRNWLTQQTLDANIENHFEQKRGLNIALAMLYVGYSQPALGVLHHILQLAQKKGHRFCELKAQIYSTWALFALGKKQLAAQALQTALNLAEPMRIVTSFMIVPEPVTKFYHQVFQSGDLSSVESRHLMRVLELTKRRHQTNKAQVSLPEAISTLALTAKEWEVLQLIGQSQSNEAIAEQMHIAISTVRSHIKHIYQKLGITSRAEGKRVAQTLQQQANCA
jgi:LuxR family maltose regulon positive regulatory protein